MRLQSCGEGEVGRRGFDADLRGSGTGGTAWACGPNCRPELFGARSGTDGRHSATAWGRVQPVRADRWRLTRRSRRCLRRLRPSGRTRVAVEQPTDSFVDDDVAFAGWIVTVDQLVPESLVRSLGMVVVDVFAQDALEVGLAEHDDPVEALS